MLIFPSYFVGPPKAYEIEQSLRFDRNGYLSKTFGSTGNGRVWSLSVWLKRAGGIGDNDRDIFGAYTSPYPRVGLVECGAGPSSDHFGVDQGGPSSNGTYYANGRRRDPSAWYHLVISVDYNSPSVKIWVNGVLEGAASNSLAADGGLINSADMPHMIGGRVDSHSASNRWDGYMAEFHFLDNDSQLSDPYDFGEFDNNGIWRPIEVSGVTYGDNGFYLKFDPTATNGIGHDYSGNGNNWTATGFTTSGTGTDVMEDTPTKNWCTLNPLDKYNNSAVVAQNGNLEFNQSAAAWYAMRASFGMTSGKWYWESKNISGLYQAPGLGNSDADLNGYASEPDTWLYVNTGQLNTDGTLNSAASWGGNSHTTNDIVGVAFDADNGKLWFSKNGTWQGDASPNPATDTDPAVTGLTDGPYFPYFVQYQTTTEVNFGQRDFAYTPPTGFKALNTANLPAPTIKDGSKYFDTKLFTAGTTTVTGFSFQPDWVWVKNRDQSYNHRLIDVVRGVKNDLYSNATTDEQTNQSDSLLTFTSDGFTHGKFGSADADDFVAWNWKAGGSGSSNTDGSVTSTVSANPTAGFSIITYQANGTAGMNFGHGLGVAPGFVICKNRDDVNPWIVWHKDLPETNYLLLNDDGKQQTQSDWITTSSSTITWDSLSGSTTTNGSDYIVYAFAEVDGYSKFGKYTGNGSSSDAPFIYTGFRPSFILFKNYAHGSEYSWSIVDNTRDTYNPVQKTLYPDKSNAEDGTVSNVDFCANGFKLRNTWQNENGSDHIYVAFAENPFGGDGVSPATAR